MRLPPDAIAVESARECDGATRATITAPASATSVTAPATSATLKSRWTLSMLPTAQVPLHVESRFAFCVQPRTPKMAHGTALAIAMPPSTQDPIGILRSLRLGVGGACAVARDGS